ncbi:MAG TPA: hypothetical protein P5513_07100 [Candidatus Diapherotrites archaeon]|nr:hypothetical protein [Candidatus Diapherotrites archaeon]
MIKSRILILVDIVITMLFLIAISAITPINANYFIYITFYAILSRSIIDSVLSLLEDIRVVLKPKVYHHYSKILNNTTSKLVKYCKYNITSWIKTSSYCLLTIIYVIYFTFNIDKQHSYLVMYLIIILYAIYILSRLLLSILYERGN